MKYKKPHNKNKPHNISGNERMDKEEVNTDIHIEEYDEEYEEASDGKEAYNNISGNDKDIIFHNVISEKKQLDDEKGKEAEDDSGSENDTPQESVQTSALFDSIMSDNRVIAALGGAILLFIGSYLSFWGVKGDVGKLSQGNLFTGYMAGGIFGKLCVLAAAVAAVLVCIRVYKAAWYVLIISAISYIIQVLLIMVNGKNVLGSGMEISLYPGFGSIVCLAGIVIMLIFIKKLSEKQ